MNIKQYISSAYNTDVGTYLLRMLKLLDITHDGWDDQPLIDILTDTRATYDLAIRDTITNAVIKTLSVYGITFANDDIPLEIYVAVLDTVTDPSPTTMSYTDTVWTLSEMVSARTGVDPTTVATYIDTVHHTTIAALTGDTNQHTDTPNNLEQLKKFTDTHGVNISSALIDINIIPGLSVEYYLSLFGDNIRTDVKGMVLDVYSIYLLAELPPVDGVLSWLEDNSLRTQATKYLYTL